jgi:hypothetical protein
VSMAMKRVKRNLKLVNSEDTNIVKEVLTEVHGESPPNQEGGSCWGAGTRGIRAQVGLRMLCLHRRDQGRDQRVSSFSGGAKYGRSGGSLDIDPEIYQYLDTHNNPSTDVPESC